MKTFKQLKWIMTALFFGIFCSNAIAQVTTISDATTINREWQFSARLGYDFPLFDEDFKYIKYNGGLMGGLSANHYWRKWGIQADFDFLNNSPDQDGLTGSKYFEFGPTTQVLSYANILVQKENIKRMFFGVGPAYRHYNATKTFQSEFSLLLGLGKVDGGEVLVEGERQNGTLDLLTYHSGFDNLTLFTGKVQMRFTYFFNEHWGVNAGAYYMKHFGGAEESSVNSILRASTYGSGLGANNSV